jgi:hypothetical protein
MPSPDNFPTFGVAEAALTPSSKTVELRLDPDDAARAARLGLKATVTIITGPDMVRREVGFGTALAPTTRLVISSDGRSIKVDAAAGGTR